MADAPAGLALLRQEVPAHLIGKLPRVTCRVCSKGENCQQHRKVRCEVCHGYISSQHIHLDYVGHAETTSILLDADPAWSWEPMAFDADGLPKFDAINGLWIRLTVCGVTRIGYGTAENAGFKAKGDLVKEVIGDAIRNAAMRFGVALNLWAKTDIHERTPREEPESRPAQRPKGSAAQEDPWATSPPPPIQPGAAEQIAAEQAAGAERPKASAALLKTVNTEVGKRVGSKREDRLAFISQIVGREITSTSELLVDEARGVLQSLVRADERNAAGPPEGWTPEQSDQLAADFLAALQGARTDQERTDIAKQIGAAVKAEKLTAADRETLLAAYTGRQPVGAGV